MDTLTAPILFSIAVFFGTLFILQMLHGNSLRKQRIGLMSAENSAAAGPLPDLVAMPNPARQNAGPFVFCLSVSLGAAMLWNAAQPGSLPLKLTSCVLTGLIFCKVWIMRKEHVRRLKIEEELPPMLDLLQLCIEAGMSMNAALVRVAEEYKGSPLADLFRQTFQEMNLGVPLNEAFTHMGERAKVADIKFFATAVIQADKLGLSLADNLKNHARLVRETLRSKTREKIQKLPIKMIIPLILFIMPAIFTVVAGPAFIQLAHGFFRK
jgi:pilus assembly protein TadC